MAVFPSNLQWLGLAKETTPGTAMSAPAVWIPVVDPKWTPQQTMLKDDALRGSMASTFQQIAGVRYDTFDYKTYLYLDSLPYHMLNLLGGTDTVTGSADPWTHTIGLKNTGDGQPNSFTAFLYNGSECWQMAGSQLAQGEFDISAEGMASSQYQWMGQPAVKMGSPPTNTPTSLKPWASWNSTITLGGSAKSHYSSVKYTIKRETAPIHTADGTQAPFLIFVGPITVTGEFDGVYQGYTGSEIEAYIGNTQPTLNLQINPVGDATHFGKWQHSQIAYDEASISAQAGKWVEVNAKWEALAQSTDAVGGGLAPVKFSLTTAVSAAL